MNYFSHFTLYHAVDAHQLQGNISNMLFIVILSGSCISILAIPIPIQKPEPGTRYDQNSVGAQVKLEVFVDLHCSDSAAVWPELKAIYQSYGRDKVDLIIHQFPLPYHQYAYIASQVHLLILIIIYGLFRLTYLIYGPSTRSLALFTSFARFSYCLSTFANDSQYFYL